MADKIIQEYVGFDHNDVDADSRSGSLATAVCSIVDAPAPPYGTYCLKIAQSKTLAYFLAGDLYTYTPATAAYKAAYVYLDSTNFPPPALNPIAALLGCVDENGTFYWYIRVDDAGDFKLYDSANNLLDTYNNPSTNTWYRIEMNYEPGDATGSWEWYIQEAGASRSSQGAGIDDFSVPAGTKHAMYLGGQGGDPLGAPLFVCHGGAYLMNDSGLAFPYIGRLAGKTGDFLAVYEGGNITLNDATPDCDENGVADAGDDLTVGTWNLAGDANLATLCSYFAAQKTTKGGAVRVAAPVSRRTDYLHAAKWNWRYEGGLGTKKGVYGLYDPKADQYNVDVTDALPISAVARYTRKVVDWPNELGDHAPTYDGQAVMGFTVSGTDFAPGTMTFYEGYFSTLEAIPLVTPKPSVGKFAEVWRNKKGRPL